MQFSVVAILAAFAVSAYAVPTHHYVARDDCDALKCAAALGPNAVSCTSAAVKEGLNPISDASCLGSLIKNTVDPPAACAGCASSLGSAVASAAGSAESLIGKIF